MRELINTRVDQKTLKAPHAAIDERGELSHVTRNDAAPKCGIDRTVTICDGSLFVKPGDGGCRRDAVERHIDDRCDPAGSSRTSSGLVAFPLGPTRFVNMNVSVDVAGHDDQLACIDKLYI